VISVTNHGATKHLKKRTRMRSKLGASYPSQDDLPNTTRRPASALPSLPSPDRCLVEPERPCERLLRKSQSSAFGGNSEPEGGVFRDGAAQLTPQKRRNRGKPAKCRTAIVSLPCVDGPRISSEEVSHLSLE
jgi:hypothetical protein